MPYTLYLDKNFNPRLVLGIMPDTFTVTNPVHTHHQSTEKANFADIIYLPSGEQRFVTKNDVVDQCQIAIGTFQNWLRYTPAQDFEVKVGEGGKKLFRIDYIEKLFSRHGNLKDFQKLLAVPTQSQGDANPVLEQVVKAKDETIEILREQNKELLEQLENHRQTIDNFANVVKQSQFLQNEANRQTQRLEQERLLLLEEKIEANKQIQKLEQDKLLLLEEKTAAQNPPKKGFWKWF